MSIEQAAVTPKPAIEIIEVLGQIEAPGAQLSGTPRNNSTRWTFDILFHGGEIEVFLINPYGNRFRPDALDWVINPLAHASHDGRAFGRHDRESGAFVFCALKTDVLQKYRVTINSVHR